MINKSVLIGHQYDAFISRQIKEGKFESTEEVVHAGLKLLEEKLRLLQKALESGEQSGFVENFDPEDFLRNIRINKIGF